MPRPARIPVVVVISLAVAGPARAHVHSTARIDTKEQYIESIGAGTLRYETFAPKERRVRLLGAGGAVVAGLAHSRAVASNGSRLDADVRYTAVYEHQSGVWRLVAWQTTRVP